MVRPNDMDKMVYGQNGIGQNGIHKNGTDRMVRTKWQRFSEYNYNSSEFNTYLVAKKQK